MSLFIALTDKFLTVTKMPDYLRIRETTLRLSGGRYYSLRIRDGTDDFLVAREDAFIVESLVKKHKDLILQLTPVKKGSNRFD